MSSKLDVLNLTAEAAQLVKDKAKMDRKSWRDKLLRFKDQTGWQRE